jgi:chaperone modulatory protein CbpM
MQVSETVTGVLVDEAALNLEEMAHACDVEPKWVEQHVRAGVLGSDGETDVSKWRFRSHDLVRARLLLGLERDFDANEELAALVLDLGDEIKRLRARLRVLGAE